MTKNQKIWIGVGAGIGIAAIAIIAFRIVKAKDTAKPTIEYNFSDEEGTIYDVYGDKVIRPFADNKLLIS